MQPYIGCIFHKYNMQKLDETSIALFKDSPSKRFLIDVINALADHGHVSVEAINKKDEEHSLVWNWLNKAASTFSVDRIIQVLQRLNLFTESKSVDLPVLTEYRMFTPRNEDAKRVRETQKKVINDQRALLLQLQLATYDLIKDSILNKVPSAKYKQFKNGEHYIGKIVYETDHNGDEASLWFRNDGLIVCSTDDPSTKKTLCYTDAEVDAWIAAHPAAGKFEGTNITPENVQQVAKIISDSFSNTRSGALQFTPFKKQDKVLGIQTVFIPSIGDIEIWYRSTQGVFCKSRAGYREILSVEKLTEYLQKLAKR